MMNPDSPEILRRFLRNCSSKDYIFELSVCHRIDKYYHGLHDHISILKSKCNKVIFLELISPPLEGGISLEEVGKLVEFAHIYSYHHKIRKMRSLYRIEVD